MLQGTTEGAAKSIVNTGFGTVAKVDDGFYGQREPDHHFLSLLEVILRSILSMVFCFCFVFVLFMFILQGSTSLVTLPMPLITPGTAPTTSPSSKNKREKREEKKMSKLSQFVVSIVREQEFDGSIILALHNEAKKENGTYKDDCTGLGITGLPLQLRLRERKGRKEKREKQIQFGNNKLRFK